MGRRPRQTTILRLMIAVFLASLILAIIAHWERQRRMATLKAKTANQEIATLGAEAAYQNARLTREVAELAVTEYVEGIFKSELKTIQGEIVLASSELKRAEDRLDWSNRMFEKGYVSKAQNIADKVTREQKDFAYEQAQTKQNVLEQYTKDKTIKELKSEVEKARADELARKATYEKERATLRALLREIEG